jgi:predicted small lipoprotein YifL
MKNGGENMKRAVSLLVVLIMSLVTLAGCSSPGKPANQQPAEQPPANQQPLDGEGIVKMGIGHITSIAKSKDFDAANNVMPTGQVDTVITVVGFDKDDRVVSITIDTAQTSVAFDEKLQLATDPKGEFKTKVELGDEYGMIKASSIKKNWYEQMAELEKWMVGKTVDEIKAMKVKQKDESHPAVPDVPELTSLVTVTVQDYLEAVEEAHKNARNLSAEAVKVGLGHEISIGKSVGYSAADGKETLPAAQVDTVIAAAAFDEEGKVVGVIIDTAQTKVEFSKEGKVTTDKNGEFKTKVELGDEYGMIKASSIKKNWYEQMAELEKWMVGKTVDEIKAMKVKQKDESHPAVPDVPELTSLVTVTVHEYLEAVAEAYENAK